MALPLPRVSGPSLIMLFTFTSTYKKNWSLSNFEVTLQSRWENLEEAFVSNSEAHHFLKTFFSFLYFSLKGREMSLH